MNKKILIIGGGAAGIFAAITAAELSPTSEVTVIDKGPLLTKVRISGGGRCNVTHSCFDPKALVKNYPRGEKELLGPFSRFQPKDTIEWFKQRGVALKVEDDGRMFPTTDSSETIINCLLNECKRLNIQLHTQKKITHVARIDEQFHVTCADESILIADRLMLATGNSPQGHSLAQELGHTIVPPVPSLFTFNVPTSPLLELSGRSVDHAIIGIEGTKFEQSGPLLLTHWGFSGPAALKLSAWAARYLHECDYKTTIYINWLPELSLHQLEKQFLALKQAKPTLTLSGLNDYGIAKNLWKRLIETASLSPEQKLVQMSHKQLSQLAKKLHHDCYQQDGKTTYKQEFVTCGGVALSEVDFKTMESRCCPHLYFGGELLDIDGVTGGFNFQNAWTTGWIAAHAMSSK